MRSSFQVVSLKKKSVCVINSGKTVYFRVACSLFDFHFRCLIEGDHVILLTSHISLCSDIHHLNPAKEERQKHLLVITEYIPDITLKMHE